MRTIRLAAALVLLLAGCAHVAAPPRNDLAGTWRLVEFWNRAAEDQPKQYPYGEHPLGYIVYDRAGNVFVQMATSTPPPRVTEQERRQLTAAQLATMMDEYVAYFGTYTIDAAKGVVTHHVLGDVRREYTGTDQPRPFRLHGDELIIGDSKTWLRRFERVKETP